MARASEVDVRPKNDAYTGLLAISFLALVAATVLMAMDAKDLGDPPGKLKIDVPGTTPGKAGSGLERPPLGGGGAPGGGGAAPGKDGMGKAEPRNLPPLPEVAAAAAASEITPVKAEVKADPDAPPIAPPAFVPPM